jgi:hypothetical protein
VPVIPVSQPDRIRGSNKNADSCFYFPKYKSSVCGGQREGPQKCEFVKSGRIKIPNMDAFLEEKKVFKDKQRAARTRVRRGTKRHRKPKKLKANAAIIRDRVDGISKH